MYAWLGVLLLLASVAIPLILILGLPSSRASEPASHEFGAKELIILSSVAIWAVLGLGGVALLLMAMLERNRGDLSSPRVGE